MKKFLTHFVWALIVLLSLLSVETLSAQKLTVEKFELRERDLTAKVNPRDAPINGDPCALVRVQIAAPNCIFSNSYIVGEVEAGYGEYLVYMAKGARNLRISHPDYLFTPLDFTFPEPLEGRRTYALILEVPIYTHYAEIVEQQTSEAGNQLSKQPSYRATTTSSSSNEKTWKVGDYYNENGKEGVVFWVDESGKHGKIVSMTESSSRLQWTSDKKERKQLIGANNETDGAKNMAIVKQILDWHSKYPAFAWCADLGEGWYLPAIEELKIFTTVGFIHDLINRTLAQHGGEQLANKGDSHNYWSSTEYDEKSLKKWYCANFVNMGTINLFKHLDFCYVRAVSAF